MIECQGRRCGQRIPENIHPQEAVELLRREHARRLDSKYMFSSPLTGGMYHPDSVVSIHKKLLKGAGQEATPSCPAVSGALRAFSRVGHGVGQPFRPTFRPSQFEPVHSKEPRSLATSGLFWSCWADSNCRPHPYQNSLKHYILCSLSCYS